MKQEQVPTARVRGGLPPLGPTRSDEAPHGFVLPLYTLYSLGQVALATFLGTPLAGAWLVARNFKKLGSAKTGWAFLALGLVWTAGLCGLGMLDKLPGTISLASIPAMVLLMRGVQGDALDRHTSLGGKSTSWGYVVAAGVACLAIVVAAVVAIALGYHLMTRAPSVEAPNGGAVMYVDGATEKDAMRLRDALADMKYWNSPSSVQLERESGRWLVSFVVTDRGLLDPEESRKFGDLADQISHRAFKDEPVDVALVDLYMVRHRMFRFEERLQVIALDSDEVRFRDITEEQARTIGRVLTDKHYFEKTGNVAQVEHKLGRLSIELWMPEDTAPTALEHLIHQTWALDLSRELDREVDLRLGDLDGKTYASYPWSERPQPPVVVEDGTMVFYRDGGTMEEARRVGATVLEHDKDADVMWAIVLRDDNFEPARAVVAIVGDDESPDLQHRLHQLAAPLSKALGNEPVDIRIVDDELALEVVLSWEKRPKSRGAIRPTR